MRCSNAPYFPWRCSRFAASRSSSNRFMICACACTCCCGCGDGRLQAGSARPCSRFSREHASSKTPIAFAARSAAAAGEPACRIASATLAGRRCRRRVREAESEPGLEPAPGEKVNAGDAATTEMGAAAGICSGLAAGPAAELSQEKGVGDQPKLSSKAGLALAPAAPLGNSE